MRRAFPRACRVSLERGLVLAADALVQKMQEPVTFC